MSHPSDAFEVEVGIAIEGGVGIFSGPSLPLAADYPAGSMFIRNDGEVYTLINGKWTKNKSYIGIKKVPENENAVIPDGYESIVSGSMKILGDLIIKGEVKIL